MIEILADCPLAGVAAVNAYLTEHRNKRSGRLHHQFEQELDTVTPRFVLLRICSGLVLRLRPGRVVNLVEIADGGHLQW